jgi:hypothetical protein
MVQWSGHGKLEFKLSLKDMLFELILFLDTLNKLLDF